MTNDYQIRGMIVHPCPSPLGPSNSNIQGLDFSQQDIVTILQPAVTENLNHIAALHHRGKQGPGKPSIHAKNYT